MIYLRIKAKSGLHAGATWTLSNGVVALGANTHSDVFLCDPDIPNTLVSLKKNGRKYVVESLHDEVRVSSADRVLLPSHTLTVDFRQVQLEIDVLNMSSDWFASLRDAMNHRFHQGVQLFRNVGLKAFAGLVFLITFLLTVMIVFYGTTGGEKVEASVLKHAAAKGQTVQQQLKQQQGDQMAIAAASELDQVAHELKIQDLNVQVNRNRVQLSAALSRVQAVGVERALGRIARDYGQAIQINAKVQLTPEQRLVDQIQVEQVVLGQRPVVVLSDGSRLYVGGRYHGVRLVAVDKDKLVFKGNVAYEVLL